MCGSAFGGCKVPGLLLGGLYGNREGLGFVIRTDGRHGATELFGTVKLPTRFLVKCLHFGKLRWNRREALKRGQYSHSLERAPYEVAC